MLKFVAEPSATNSPSASRKTPSPTPQNLTPTKKRRTTSASHGTLYLPAARSVMYVYGQSRPPPAAAANGHVANGDDKKKKGWFSP